MMRDAEKTILVDRTVQDEVILNKEEIAKYEVDKRNQNITIEIRLTGNETSRVETETYRFFSSDFIAAPTEKELWQLVDTKRSGI